LTSFLEAAASAVAAAVTEEAGRYESANVVATVTSHVKARPDCHGTKVTPSGSLTLIIIICYQKKSPDGSKLSNK